MKILALFMCWVFAFLFIARLVEMSLIFDWIDIVWALVFLVGLIISTVLHSFAADGD